MFGHGLDPQATDLIAAKAVREAMSTCGERTHRSIDELVRALVNAGALDREIALYVAMNPDRFVLSDPPQHIDARWCVGAARLAS